MQLLQPESISFLKRYSQAKNLSKTTSRSTNPNWYADALALNIQWHIFVGSDTGAISYIRNVETGAWAKGPNISPEIEEDASLLKPILDGISTEYLAEAKHPGIGVILYVADEFSTAELGPEHQNPAEIEELRRLIKEDPRSILEDQSISNQSHAWRLFPYPGAASGQPFATAIAFTRRHEHLLEECRRYGNDNNIPVRTRAISAPLCAITALPWLLEQKPQNGFVALYHYPRFTALSFFNPHGDLILIRTLQHHGSAPFSPQTANAIMTTAASLELADPHIFIIPMAGFAPMGMSDSLSSMLPNSQVITLSPTSSALHIPTAPSAASKTSDLGVTRPWKWSDLTAQTAVESEPTQSDIPESDSVIPGVTRPWKLQDMAAAAMLSQVRLEVVSTTNPPSASKSILAESHTFKILVEEMWPVQDFLPPSHTEATLYPDFVEMKLLKWSKYLKIAAVAGVAALGATATLGVVNAMRHPSWGYTSTNPSFTVAQHQASMADYEKTNTLLSDRSRAWSNMELINKLFPENTQITIDSFNYSTSISAQNATNRKIPIIRTWNIKGEASNRDRSLLDRLNTTEGMREVFQQVFETTGDDSFDINTASRQPRPDLKIKLVSNSGRRSQSKSDTQSLNFVMSITQRLDDKDPLTLPLAK